MLYIAFRQLNISSPLDILLSFFDSLTSTYDTTYVDITGFFLCFKACLSDHAPDVS